MAALVAIASAVLSRMDPAVSEPLLAVAVAVTNVVLMVALFAIWRLPARRQ